jgi:myo-inositol-1(or 4)-monophosphatase
MTTEPEFSGLEVAIRSAGEVLMAHFGKALERTYKTTSADFQTAADLAAERILIEAIEGLFPDYNIIAEEHGSIGRGSEFSFVIDPLDGTNNFVLGIPAFVTNVALMKGGETIGGWVHHPVTGDLYAARKGQGAFVNASPIRVNNEARREKVTVSYYCNYTTPAERVVAFKSALLKLGIQRSLDLWAPGFCFCALAGGRLEAVINDGTELYDYAAGKLIALEAGARISTLEGDPQVGDDHETFLLSNGSALHEYLVETVTAPLAAAHGETRVEKSSPADDD